MDQNEARLAAIETKIDDVKKTVDRTYRIFFWSAVIAVASIILPLIGLLFAVPVLISNYSSLLGS